MEEKLTDNQKKMIFMTATNEELISSISRHRINIEKDIREVLKEHTEYTIDELTKSEFKYIRLNIEDMFIVEGKLKVEYIIFDNNNLAVASMPNALDFITFKSLYSDTDSFLFKDIIQEIYQRYYESKKYRYTDTKENYLKEYMDMYSDKIQKILETLILCDEDTIEIKKIGDITQVKLINTVDKERREIPRVLDSYETFKTIKDLKPYRYRTIQELIKTKPFDIDYFDLIDEQNKKLKSDIESTFDTLYKNDKELYKHKDEICNNLYEKTKITE